MRTSDPFQHLRSGRRRYANPDQMALQVDLYFKSLEVLDEDGEVVSVKLPTQSGLARFLGFSSPAALWRYEGYDHGDWKWVIDDARMRLGEVLEELVMDGKNGAQFLIKNLDRDHWRDRTEQSVDVTERIPELNVPALRAQMEKQLPEPDEEDDESWK